MARALSPLVRRIVAPNPGLMTGPGTNTYLVGIDEIAVIDPGPDDPEHLDAIAGCGGDRIRWIVCTHTHPDHSPGAAGLKARTGAEVLAWDSRDGLEVDQKIKGGHRIEATEFRLLAVHTPGHASNHLCYLLEEEHMLFSGDHIMQGSTVVISPPDGNMTQYLESLAAVRAIRLRSIAPGHGHLIEDPKAVIDEYIEHRLAREQQILDLLVRAGHQQDRRPGGGHLRRGESGAAPGGQAHRARPPDQAGQGGQGQGSFRRRQVVRPLTLAIASAHLAGPIGPDADRFQGDAAHGRVQAVHQR